MTETKSMLEDFTGENEKLPGILNVATILTIIGSVLGIGGGIWQFITAKSNYEKAKAALNSPEMENAPEWAKKMMSPEYIEMARKSLENKWPLLLVTLIGSALCLYGALEMRKRKKQGYILWLAGEVLPLIAGVFLVGTTMFSGLGAIGLIFPLIFIIIYTLYRKELRY